MAACYDSVVPEDSLWGEALNVDETTGQRWRVALEILAEGGYVVWRNIGLTLRTHIVKGRSRGGPRLFVRVSSELEPDHVTPARAEAELRRAQAELEELKQDSPEFARLVRGRPTSYALLYNYGMGAVQLATWTDEGFEYVWKPS